MDENRNLIDVIDENKLIEVTVDVGDTGDVVDDLQDQEEVLPENDVVDVPVDVLDEVDVQKKIEGKSRLMLKSFE